MLWFINPGDRYVSPDDAAIERECNLVRTQWQFPGSYGGAPGNAASAASCRRGFFEWQVLADGKTKQPYYITLNDQDIFGFAALWDSSKRDDGVTVESCTIVTMPANALMTEIHNAKHRMPAILTKDDRDAWLTTTPDNAFQLLRQYPDTHMVAMPVSKRVNTPKNNDAELIAPASVA
jgi:putative SOS response-associated peptidase YedK